MASGEAHQRRAGRAVLRRPLHRLPRGAARRRTEKDCSSPARVSSHVFVDETKERDYLLIASVHVSGELDDVRKLMRGLVLRGQRRVHMKKESDPRRRAIAAAICGAGVTATVYDAGQRYPRSRRLPARPGRGRGRPGRHPARDRTRRLTARLGSAPALRPRQGGAATALEHRRASAEQLLAILDAIAWCWAKGGHWRRRIQPAVTTVRQV